MTILVYDGDCPFCSRYAEFARIRQRIPDLELLDARTNRDHRAVQQVLALGLSLDEGMALVRGDEVLHGADVLAALADKRSPLASTKVARLTYPVLRAGRNFTLRLLGRKRLDY